MKNKDQYLKRVYKRVPFKGGFWFDDDHSLGRDFYQVNLIAICSDGRFKIEYNDKSLCCRVVAWKDKHENVIVRFMSNYKQLSFDF